MPFPWTLQRYIFREMGKAFLLAVAALTGVLSFGGGVLEMIKLGEVTPGQLVRMLTLLVPLSAALTLPVAALFSAAATYGRFSADNEFVACRSSGINLHILFVPTVILSLASATVSFGLTNYLIPGMVRNLNELVDADVGSLIQQRLNRPRGISLGKKFRVHADSSRTDPDSPQGVLMDHVAFIEGDGDHWVRFGTAEQIRLRFRRNQQAITVDGAMRGLGYYDRRQGQFFTEAEQIIPPNEIPSFVPLKVKYLNLNELLSYRSRPEDWYEVREEVDRLRRGVASWQTFDDLQRRWSANDHTLKLNHPRGSAIFHSDRAARGTLHGELVLYDATITQEIDGRVRVFEVETATLELTRGGDLGEVAIQADLRGVRLTDDGPVITRAKETIGPFVVDSAQILRMQSWDINRLCQMALAIPDDPLNRLRTRATDAKGKTVRRVVGVLNERAAFSISVFVLIILAAALGIILRGSHVMMAFGISFVPMLFVILTIVMGKQMSHNAGTHFVGLALMWSGIVTVAGVDVWTLTKVLRR